MHVILIATGVELTVPLTNNIERASEEADEILRDPAYDWVERYEIYDGETRLDGNWQPM